MVTAAPATIVVIVNAITAAMVAAALAKCRLTKTQPQHGEDRQFRGVEHGYLAFRCEYHL